MGEYLSKTCCFDKVNLATYENFTSRISSPVNYEFQRIILEIPNKEARFDEQFMEDDSPDKKPRMIRRTISGVSEIKLEEGIVRSAKRRLTYKGGENFLMRAKKRLLSISSMDTPKEHEERNSFTAKVQGYENLHISIPDGDLDWDV